MSTQRLRLVASNTPPARVDVPALHDMRPLGQVLLSMGAISENDLDHALEQQRRLDATLGDILISHGKLTQLQLQAALAEQHALRRVDLEADPPDPRAANLLPPALCVGHRVIPWLQLDDILLVATSRPDLFPSVMDAAPRFGLTLLPVLADETQIQDAVTSFCGQSLAYRAEARVDEHLSCRSWDVGNPNRGRTTAAAAFAVFALCIVFPGPMMLLFTALACVAMGLSLTLKGVAALAELTQARRPPAAQSAPTILKVPKVSMLVPLLHETEIASALLRRLSRLTYPKSQLDVILVLEASDTITRDTLSRTDLPSWMRVITVPQGDGLLTKPRALNYALDFCRGSIIGIWDAEDAPSPDQIEHVVSRFHEAPPETVCLQGRLDYYNARSNWLSRCFTIEYATWWRLIMPGLARLGCVIPLGGTTLFFKRKELEALGGWDAHNVTEDADLGVRLARAGYKTELIDTTTYEEANCRAWPWVKQRSRWLKGFAVTWLVHMREPRTLYRDLGFYRFTMLQVFFITALSPFLLAPVFWSYWLLALTGAHPAAAWPMIGTLLTVFLAAEVFSLVIHLIAVRKPAHRHLALWTPTLTLYFTLGTLAAYKAMYELIWQPFYWDKTEHGVCKTVRHGLEDRPHNA